MIRLIAAASALLLAACQAQTARRQCRQAAEAAAATATAPILATADAVDVHSYARPLEARVTHVALDLAVDFDARRVGGTATLDIDAQARRRHHHPRRQGAGDREDRHRRRQAAAV